MIKYAHFPWVPDLLRGQVPQKAFGFCLSEMKDKMKKEEKWKGNKYFKNFFLIGNKYFYITNNLGYKGGNKRV